MPLNVVLVEPEIPPNAGNAGRLCVGTGSRLHLVRPLGFDLSDKAVRRAGLDYWPHLDLRVHDGWDEFLRATSMDPARYFCFTSAASQPYTRARHRDGDYLVFGRESVGLGPERLAWAGETRQFAIPLFGPVRSLNLSNAVAVVVYGALRQIHPDAFPV